MPKKRAVHSAEYKREALRRIIDGKESVSMVAAELGHSRQTVYRWIREFQSDPNEAFRGNGNLTSQDEEIRKLRRKVAELEEDRAILKKAAAFFAREPR